MHYHIRLPRTSAKGQITSLYVSKGAMAIRRSRNYKPNCPHTNPVEMPKAYEYKSTRPPPHPHPKPPTHPPNDTKISLFPLVFTISLE